VFPFSDYYEEMLTILDLFTCESVSPMMWQMFGIIYEAFERDGFDYFSGKYIVWTVFIMIIVFSFAEMMDVVYNFIRIDTQTFLSNPKHIEIVISMSKTVRCSASKSSIC
jgi:importin-8